jgi:hypothetical protein
MSKRALVPINVLASNTEPVGQHAGDLYFNPDDHNLYVFDGIIWTEIATTPSFDIVEGGDEADGSDSYIAVVEGGDEAGGSDSYTSSYDGGGVI